MDRKFWIRSLAVILTLTVLWGVSENRKAQDFKTATENQYRRSLSDFVTQLDALETNLAKSRAAGTPTQQVFYLSQSWHQSDTAVKDLALLPADKFGLAYIDQFLNQVGEFTKNLTQDVAKGNMFNPEQDEMLAKMHKRLITVNSNVQEFYVDLNTEKIAWLDSPTGQAVWPNKARVAPASALGEEDKSEKPSSIRSSLEQLDASLQKLPPFSYTGQTDTHSVPEPLGLSDRMFTEDEARAAATDFLKILGYQDAAPKLSGTSNGPMAAYIFKYDYTTIDISKKGGVVTLFLDERPLDLQRLSLDEAVSQAMTTLKKLGWKTFVKTATEDLGGMIHLEVVNEDQGFRIYPDKIRLKVGKDNGQIISYDATPYWLFHHERSFERKIDLAQAKKQLRSDLMIKETRLTVIPLPGWREALCYEFRVNKDDEDFLIYINVENGIEEKIQRIIHTPRGEFLN